MSMSPNLAKAELIKLPDGRDLAFSIFGDPTGYPIFFSHGSPGSRLEGLIYHDKALEYGLKLIVSDRPGFGNSTFQPGRQLLDYPTDIAQLANYLDTQEYGMIGHSGGGPYSLICRYANPERVTFAIAIGGYTNFAEMADATSLLKTKADRLAVSLSQSHPKLFEWFFVLLGVVVKYAPQSYLRALLNASCIADREIIETQAFGAILIKDQREAFIQGGNGAALDCCILYKDWGAKLSDFPEQILLFQGTEDRLVPAEFARHLAANIPSSKLVILEKQGHLFPWKLQDLIFQTAVEQIEPLKDRIEPLVTQFEKFSPLDKGE